MSYEDMAQDCESRAVTETNPEVAKILRANARDYRYQIRLQADTENHAEIRRFGEVLQGMRFALKRNAEIRDYRSY